MTPPLSARLLSVFLTLVSICSISHAQRKDCPESKAEQAETRAGLVRSWDALYSWYRTYHACDDGVIAETSSAAVGNLIVNRWNTLPRFSQIAKRDAAFRQFVLTHLDWTIETGDYEAKDIQTIKRNARAQCPSGLTKLCSELMKVADQALKAATTSQQ